MNRRQAKEIALTLCKHPVVTLADFHRAGGRVFADRMAIVDYVQAIPPAPRTVEIDMAAAELKAVSFLLGYKGSTFME